MIGIAIAIIAVILPIALIAMIIMAASKKNRDDITGVERSIRNVYIYTLLIIFLIAIISCSIYALRIGLDIIIPEETTYYNSYNMINKNEKIVNLFTSISIIIVSVPLFVKHSKLAKESNNN